LPRIQHTYIVDEFKHSLEMTREPNTSVAVPKVPAGYALRQFDVSDSENYLDLIHSAWPPDEFSLESTIECSLSGGFFVIEHVASGKIVATAMTGQGPPRVVRNSGRIWLGWVVTDSEHTRLGLGRIVVASAINRLVRHGRPQMFIGSEDERLVAIALYLDLGWRPLMWASCMPARWSSIYEKLRRSPDYS